MLVVSEGSLNDLISRAVGFAFRTGKWVHVSISWSVIRCPDPVGHARRGDVEPAAPRFLHQNPAGEARKPMGCWHTRLSMSVRVTSTMSTLPTKSHPVLHPKLDRIMHGLDLLEMGEHAFIQRDPNDLPRLTI